MRRPWCFRYCGSCKLPCGLLKRDGIPWLVLLNIQIVWIIAVCEIVDAACVDAPGIDTQLWALCYTLVESKPLARTDNLRLAAPHVLLTVTHHELLVGDPPRAVLALLYVHIVIQVTAVPSFDCSVWVEVLVEGLIADGGGLLVKCQPSSLFEIKNMQVVQLIGELIEASKDDHIMAYDITWMAGSTQRHVGSDPDFIPLHGLQIQCPKIIQLLLIAISAAEYIHGTLVNACRMTTPWRWLDVLLQAPAPTKNLLVIRSPLVCLDVVNVYFICPHTFAEATKYIHALCFMRNDCGVTVSGLNERILWENINCVPNQSCKIKREKSFIVFSAIWAAKEIHFVSVDHSAMMSDSSWSVFVAFPCLYPGDTCQPAGGIGSLACSPYSCRYWYPFQVTIVIQSPHSLVTRCKVATSSAINKTAAGLLHLFEIEHPKIVMCSFLDICTGMNIKLAIMNKRWVVTAACWALSAKNLAPVLCSFDS